MNHVASITLKGRLNIELIPAAKWRELALAGIKTMAYAVSGKVVIDGTERSINIKVPALDEGELVGLGEGAPWGSGEPTEIVTGLYPKNPRPRGLDTALLLTDDENKILVVDGVPQCAEAPIIILEGPEEGEEFNMFYGTHFFCPSKSGLTLRFTDVGLHETEREDEGGYPWIDASFSTYEVISAPSTRAKGEKLSLICKAARPSAAKAVAEVNHEQPEEA